MKKLNNISDLSTLRNSLLHQENKDKTCIRICTTGCRAYGALDIYDTFQKEIQSNGLQQKVEVRETGCHGFCAKAPVMGIDPKGIFYQHVTVADVPEIISQTLKNDKLVDRLLYRDASDNVISHISEIPFYGAQIKNVLRNCGQINPKDIYQYIARDGYAALTKVLSQMSPDQVIETIESAKLRGRGGAGFNAGTKWRFARRAPGDMKYIICNADEGDPGAFMDRAVLEGDPHSVLEGMLVAAYAIGANTGYIYVRAEYPIAVEHIKIAIASAEELGLLGDNILGTDYCFHLNIREGAGAFVCGEETALIASIEGKRGMPRARPPFPAQSGLGGKPTNNNNVETYANVPVVILAGSEEYSKLGTAESSGTKIFSLAGKINNTGLVEVPIGTTIEKIIFDIGGGIPKDRKIKAVQMGGPSGGCVPERHMNLPVDYGTLQSIGAVMGSGGMVVMDENNCMVEVARYFLSFTQTESCGKCSPCRLGTKQMLEILTKITEGKGKETDIDTLLTIAKTVKECSLCGLGQTCGNPVFTTVSYFRDEYEAHIKDKKCPAAVCDALMISPCQHTCPVGINVPKYVAHIAAHEYNEAIATIRDRNPFAAICGRICHHPCERKCRRGELDAPVAIRSLKRFASDWYFEHSAELPELKPFPITKQQKVAIVGAGPTGLACAYFLAQMGYKTTVFEALPIGGGMLSVAIPEFRLPRDVIQQDIDYIAGRGVEIKYNAPINVNFTLDDLKKEGFSAIFIAAGAQRSQHIGIPGELDDLEGFHYGLRFLRDIKTGKQAEVGDKVAVIGGGNVALDAARTALRLGAKDVEIYYRRSRTEMPVTDIEYEEAITEGVKINFLVSPTRITNDNWRVTGLHCVRMQLGEMDESGRRKPSAIPDSDFFIPADTVIAAVGQAPDLSFLPPDSALERTRWETLAVDANTLSTNIPGVFAGGDFVSGPGMVVHAIAAGRRGALAIDKYLKADDSRVEMYDLRGEVILPVAGEEEEETLADQPRIVVPTLPSSERKRSFKEIELALPENEAVIEAKRCLRCDLEQ